MHITNYLYDGAHYNARAVMCLLQGKYFGDKRIRIARWENCREQGYVVYVVGKDFKEQLNIAFFEHRNSDEICAIRWIESPTTNAPTIDTAKFGDVYKDKYDVSHSVSYNQCYDMAEWIYGQLKDFIGDMD